MNAATLMILLSMRDEATPKVQSFAKTIEQNRAAINALGRATMTLGASLLGMGIALKQMNNPLAQNAASVFLMVGGFMSAIGTAAQFISSIGRIAKALRDLAASEALVQALSGPAGWAILAGSLAVAGGALYAINRMSNGGGSGGNGGNTTIIHQNIRGSVVSEASLVGAARTGMRRVESRNGSSGF